MTTIKNKILHIVEHKNIRMIPKWKFLLYSSLGIVGLIFSFLLLLFIVSLILFVLARYGFMYLPLFGFGATLHVLTGVPFVLGVIGLVLVAIIKLLLRHYAFFFRKPLITTLLVIVVSALGIGFIISLTPLHRIMRTYARDHHIDKFRDMYEHSPFGEGDDTRAILRGEVISTTTDSVTISLFNNTLRTVYATTTGDPLPLLHQGDDIVVFGVMSNGRFDVMRVRSAPHLPFEEEWEQKDMRFHKGKEEMKGDEINFINRR
jgi:hypothetical protein